MNLLLTNDDGIRSPGLAALIKELSKDHRLYVSAPDRQRSAAGAAMTIRADLYAEPVSFPGYPSVSAYAVSGTPVDCVRLGFGLDGEYVERMGLGFDVKCFFGTIASVLRSDGVVEGGTGEMKKAAEAETEATVEKDTTSVE